MRVSVCLSVSVCSHISETTYASFAEFCVYVTNVWRHSGMLYTSHTGDSNEYGLNVLR